MANCPFSCEVEILTELLPRKKRTISKFASGIRESNRGMFEVLLEGFQKDKVTLSIVETLPKYYDCFLRVRGMSNSDYCILRASRLLKYNRRDKAFVITTKEVVNKLVDMGIKPVRIDNTPETSDSTCGSSHTSIHCRESSRNGAKL